MSIHTKHLQISIKGYPLRSLLLQQVHLVCSTGDNSDSLYQDVRSFPLRKGLTEGVISGVLDGYKAGPFLWDQQPRKLWWDFILLKSDTPFLFVCHVMVPVATMRNGESIVNKHNQTLTSWGNETSVQASRPNTWHEGIQWTIFFKFLRTFRKNARVFGVIILVRNVLKSFFFSCH